MVCEVGSPGWGRVPIGLGLRFAETRQEFGECSVSDTHPESPMKRRCSKLWWICVAVFVIVLAGALVLRDLLTPTPAELAVDRLFKTNLSEYNSPDFDDGVAELVSLGPDALVPLAKQARGKGTMLEELYSRYWSRLPTVVSRHLQNPLDYHHERIAVIMAIEGHGMFAARSADAAILAEVANTNGMGQMGIPAASARRQVHWLVPDSPAAVDLVVKSLRPENPCPILLGSEHLDRLPGIVPILIENLKAGKRYGYEKSLWAARSLASVGTNADVAIPELIKLVEASEGDYAPDNSPQYQTRSRNMHLFPWSRAAAVHTLAEIGGDNPAVRRALIGAWNDLDRTVQISAANAIGALGPAMLPELPALLSDFESRDNSVLSARLKAVGRLGPGATNVLPVLKQLSDTNHLTNLLMRAGMGEETVTALALTARLAAARIDPELTPALLPELARNQQISWEGIEFLTNSVAYSKEVIAAFEAALPHPVGSAPFWPEFVVLSHEPRHAKALASLKEAMRDGDLRGRLAAARWLLTTTGSADGIEDVLVAGLAGDDTNLRQQTVHLIEQLELTGRDMGEWMERAAWNTDRETRNQAARLLIRHHPERVPPLGGR